MLLLSETESEVSIISRLSKSIHDSRRFSSITHSVNDLLTQRIFQITCGYEDGNDCNSLRTDPAMKMAVGRKII
ncbi:MAG: transposase [Chlorobium sp.]